MIMSVAHKPNEITADGFFYIFPEDTDEHHPVELVYSRQRTSFVKMLFAPERIDDNVVLRLPSELEFDDGELLNLLALHNVCDTIDFRYTAKGGKPKDFRFPLAGFSQRYLAQLIE